MNPLRWFIAAGGLGVLAYLMWLLTPPSEVIGSYLDGFDSSDRRRRMIRDESEQDFDLKIED